MNADAHQGGPEPTGRSRRGPSWAQLGRRADHPQAPAAPAEHPAAEPAAPRAVAVRPAEPAEEHHLGDRLSAYLDGELGHDSRERVQAHLATCPDCLAEADEGRAVKHLLTRTDNPGPSSTLMARLLAVAALPEDEDGSGPGGGMPAVPGTLGGSRSPAAPSAAAPAPPSARVRSAPGRRSPGSTRGPGRGCRRRATGSPWCPPPPVRRPRCAASPSRADAAPSSPPADGLACCPSPPRRRPGPVRRRSGAASCSPRPVPSRWPRSPWPVWAAPRPSAARTSTAPGSAR
ncbi:zf-HC2 domain-containing protein [Kitasatospora arboriphila]